MTRGALAAAAVGAAALAALLSGGEDVSRILPGAPFPPDAGVLLDIFESPRTRAALAGALGGAVLGVAGMPWRGDAAARSFLMLFNPLTVYALTLGAAGALALAAGVVVFLGAATQMRWRDQRGALGLSTALAVAPFICNGALVIYPAVALAAPLLSPWGIRPDRLSGYLIALAAPVGLSCLSVAFFLWATGLSAPATPDPYRISEDAGVVLIGAALIGALAGRGSIWGAAAAFVLGAGVLAYARPELAVFAPLKEAAARLP